MKLKVLQYFIVLRLFVEGLPYSILVTHDLDEYNWLDYGTPNTSEVTNIFVDNQKFVLSIRITKVTITIIVDMYKSIKVFLQIHMVTIKRAVAF